MLTIELALHLNMHYFKHIECEIAGVFHFSLDNHKYVQWKLSNTMSEVKVDGNIISST